MSGPFVLNLGIEAIGSWKFWTNGTVPLGTIFESEPTTEIPMFCSMIGQGTNPNGRWKGFAAVRKSHKWPFRIGIQEEF